jgi:YihY family inner membrane protein
MFDKAKEKLLSFEQWMWKQGDELGFGKWFFVKLIRVTYLVIMKIPRERPFLRSAALTYTSTLSLLPMLGMLFAIFGIFTNETEKEWAIRQLFDKAQSYIAVPLAEDLKKKDNPGVKDPEEVKAAPDSKDEEVEVLSEAQKKQAAQFLRVRNQVIGMIDEVGTGKLSGISLLLFSLGALTLLANIERAFNDIWGIAKLRAFWYRMMSYTFIMLGTAVMAVVTFAIVGIDNLESSNIELFQKAPPWLANFMQSGFDVFLSFSVMCGFFTVLYIVMPNVQVKFLDALAGGVVAGIFFKLNASLAGFLAVRLTTINLAYGSMALIPIFLICCMIAWMIVLMGAHVASAWGNVEGFRREFLTMRHGKGYDETIALRLMLRIAENFRDDGKITNYEKVAEEWALPNARVRTLLDKLEATGLVRHIGGKAVEYTLGKELKQISVVDILSAIRFGTDGWKPLPEGPDSDRINKLVTDIHDIEEKNLKQITLASLINEKS